MAIEVIVPKVDMVMETATFVEWLKHDGEHIEKGEPLFVIMTDKASIEVESPGSGTLFGAKALPNEVLPVADVIAYILSPGEISPPQVQSQGVHSAETKMVQAVQETSSPTGIAASSSAESDSVRATPVARRLADELGVDLASVSGSGPLGRIQKDDVLRFSGQKAASAAPAPQMAVPAKPPVSHDRKKKVVPLAGARKVIAERMTRSAFTAPHITLSLSVDMSEATRLRNRLSESIQKQTGQRLSFSAILARVVAAVLPNHPYLNASLEGQDIVVWEDVNLGVATSVEDYLIVPVLRQAQHKSLPQIVAELGDLLERGRTRRLLPADMTGSTFTVSNLGMFGIESFTAIINPPESAILAVGKIVETVVSVDGEIVVRPMLNLTLSADHRIVDGVAAARFLADLKATLEDPCLLI